MITWVTITEAMTHVKFTHEHIAFLARTGKIHARKSGHAWLIDLDSLKSYEQAMKEQGTARFTPHRYLPNTDS